MDVEPRLRKIRSLHDATIARVTDTRCLSRVHHPHGIEKQMTEEHPAEALTRELGKTAEAAGHRWSIKRLGIPVAAVGGAVTAITAILRYLEVLRTAWGWSLLAAVMVLVVYFVGAWARRRFPHVRLFIDYVLNRPPPRPSVEGFLRTKGAMPYRFGENLPQRSHEVHGLLERIRLYPFTILVGQVGSGKTSLLDCGLRAAAEGELDVRVFRLEKSPQERLTSVVSDTANRDTDKPLVLCIDQFDEVFPAVSHEERLAFMRQLQMLLQESNFKVVIALRNDFHDLLSKLCREVDPEQRTFNLQRVYWLELMSEEQAKYALEEILKPISDIDESHRHHTEPFIEEIVKQLKVPADLRQKERRMVVSPLDLQIAIDTIVTLRAHFDVSDLNRYGTARGLLSAYLHQNLKSLSLPEGVTRKDILPILCELVNPSQTKRVCNAAEIARNIKKPIDPSSIQSLLESLQDSKLVTAKPPDGFELVHDWLAKAVTQAQESAEHEEEALRNQRKVKRKHTFIVAATSALVALMAYTGWWGTPTTLIDTKSVVSTPTLVSNKRLLQVITNRSQTGF